MTRYQHPLNQIQVASPCHEDWANMTGDDQVRFCQSCQLNVYNLSEMTAPEAQALVEAKEGKLCIRYYQREDGTILTQDCPKGLRAVRQKTLRVAAVVLATVSSLFGPWGAKAYAVCKTHGQKLPTIQTPNASTLNNGKPPAIMGEPVPIDPTTQPPPPIMGKIAPSPSPTEPPPNPPLMGKPVAR